MSVFQTDPKKYNLLPKEYEMLDKWVRSQPLTEEDTIKIIDDAHTQVGKDLHKSENKKAPIKKGDIRFLNKVVTASAHACMHYPLLVLVTSIKHDDDKALVSFISRSSEPAFLCDFKTKLEFPYTVVSSWLSTFVEKQYLENNSEYIFSIDEDDRKKVLELFNHWFFAPDVSDDLDIEKFIGNFGTVFRSENDPRCAFCETEIHRVANKL